MSDIKQPVQPGERDNKTSVYTSTQSPSSHQQGSVVTTSESPSDRSHHHPRRAGQLSGQGRREARADSKR